MAILEVFDIEGKKVGTFDGEDAVFSSEVKPYLHTEIVNWQRSCSRAGTQSALTKAEVSGTTKKPFPQKGRGMARQGSLKNPHQIGGGVAFAPKPRDYSYSVPKSKKRAAITSVLSLRLREGRIRILDSFILSSPKTKSVCDIVGKFGASSCLLVDSSNDNLKMSSRNLPKVKFLDEAGFNVYDVLKYPYLFMTLEAVKKIQGRLIS